VSAVLGRARWFPPLVEASHQVVDRAEQAKTYGNKRCVQGSVIHGQIIPEQGFQQMPEKNPKVAEPTRPQSKREAFLERMLRLATVPRVKQLLQDELDQEREVQELIVLIAAAEKAGESELADKLSALVAEQDSEEPPEESGIDGDDVEWLEKAAADEPESKPLSKIKVTREAIDSETGERMQIRQRADVALRDIEQQIRQVQELQACLQS